MSRGNWPGGFQLGRETSEGVVARGVVEDRVEPAASSLQPARAEGVCVFKGARRFKSVCGALFYVCKGRIHCSWSQVVEEREGSREV